MSSSDPRSPNQPTHGGGFKKVLYTWRLASSSGVRPTTKALTANNTCKACGLGMGGQAGGMTNELGEFPAVCNKSVQAQSSDLQPPIPTEIFSHTTNELAELTEAEMNRLGRLTTPLMKHRGENKYRPVEWETALAGAVDWFKETDPDRSFFYSSGRSSNEAGFILQLFARLYGTNNVNNCSYYCHQATSVALENSIGTGTATVELADLTGTDCIFVVGANPASNHPRFIYQLQACRARGGSVIVINPAKETGLVRFAMPKNPGSLIAGGSEIASHYLQPNIGSDIQVFQGLAKAVLEQNAADDPFIAQHASGYATWRSQLADIRWADITQVTGIKKDQFTAVAECYAKANHAVFAWGMGLTHHTHGVSNIEQLANLAILRGMVGRRHAGLLPLRGHSNVQGIGTIGVKPLLTQSVFDLMEQRLGVTLPTTPGMDTMSAMQAAQEGQIDLAFIMGGNLYASNPNSNWAEQALNKIKRKIFLTTTLNRGHAVGVDDDVLILPVTPRDEEWQATSQESMFNYVRLSDGGIIRHENVRPESNILTHIASAVIDTQHFVFNAFQDHSSVRQAIAATVPGLEQLKDLDVARQEFHVKNRLLHCPEFKTSDGKCHFIPAPAAPEDINDNLFPFTLSTIRSEGQFNSIVYEDEDSYRGVPHRWSVLMGDADMTRLGLQTGDQVNLRSNNGTMERVSVYPHALPSGNLMAYYPEANVLTDTSVDPRSRTPGFKSTPVAVVRTGHQPGMPKRTP
ncbi:MAG: FdhF/YdeP family oxidoreductase [Pseudomonadota bacterium]